MGNEAGASSHVCAAEAGMMQTCEKRRSTCGYYHCTIWAELALSALDVEKLFCPNVSPKASLQVHV